MDRTVDMDVTKATKPQESKIDRFTPRSYQVELLDKSTKRNIIVQLGTGAGKTFIAVLLIKEYGLQLRSPVKEGGRRAFFVVNTVALVEQQAIPIQDHTSLIVGLTHGSLNCDITTNKEMFDEFIEAHNVVVLTAQVLVDLINSAFLKMSSVALLIFDECHHALGSNHPYRKIMDRYMDEPRDERPRVLGLTASLINNKTEPKILENSLTKLEQILDCTIETTCDLVNVSKYGAKPSSHLSAVKNFVWNNAYSAVPLKFLDAVRSFCKSTNEFLPDIDYDVRKPIIEAAAKTHSVLKLLGPWAAWKIAQLREKELRNMRKQAVLGEKQLDYLILGETAMITTRRLLEPKMKPIQKVEALKETLPPKFVQLLKILEVYNPERQEREAGSVEPLCGIVFVDQRYIAYVIRMILKSIVKWEPDLFGFLKVDYIIGNNSGSFESENSQLQNKRLEDVLRKFRKGELNLLIATNVLEEGVDVKHCNLVIKFDRPNNFRSYVQSRGRARKAGGHYFVIVEEKEVESCTKDLVDFDEIEKLLLRRSRSVHNPNESDLPSSVDDLIAPYTVPSTGAKVFLTGAIQLINRYCGKLPSDVFTRLVPQSRIIPVESLDGQMLYSAELLLPMNSPHKEAILLDEPVHSKKLAQMLVAMKAIKVLHEKAELNDHLLPVGKESVLALLDDDPDEYAPADYARVGSVKRKQLYDKKIATVLHNARPVKGEMLYLYVLELDIIHPLTPEENPKNRKIINPKDTDFCFGFLSREKLPQVPSFPAFIRQGEARASIVLAPNRITLNEQTLTYLKMFHHYIFKYVLQLTKDALELCLDESSPITTIVVPLNRIRKDNDTLDYSIQMDYVKEVVNNMEDMPRVPDDEERRRFEFNAEDWKDKVVMPWYRNIDQPMFFYVVDEIADLHPWSQFPDEEFETFNEYYNKKYNLEIMDQNQSLLEVEYTSNRLNLLLPRTRSRARTRPNVPTTCSQRQILIPELVDRHPISALLFHSIASIPSLFYRLNGLLVADEMRVKVLTEALGKRMEETLPPDNFWLPLSYPSTQEEKHSVMVTRLSQLRDKEGSEKSSKRSRKDEDKMEETFHIGVWDPSLADHLVHEPSAQKKVDGWLDGTPTLHDVALPTGGDMSDDEDEHEHTLYFHHAQFTKDVSKLTAPRPDVIQEIGWGDIPNDVNQPSFMILDASPHLNIHGLMADLAGDFPPLDDTSMGTFNAPEDVTSMAPEEKRFLPKQLRDVYEGEEDESDKEKETKKEESIDLISFDDDPVLPSMEVGVKLEKSKSEEEKDEMNILEIGEKWKAERDHKAVNVIKEEIKEGKVMAMPLSTARFSFHCASTAESVTRLFSLTKGNDCPYGVSPCLLLTALTTSNANDGINLERLETIGDSFLKFTVTDFLYHKHPDLHEGKLSFARSKEVSNCNLYRLGKKLGIPFILIASKFEVQETWLPPCYITNFKAPNCADAELKDEMMEKMLEGEEVPREVEKTTGWDEADIENGGRTLKDGVETITLTKAAPDAVDEMSPLPYNYLTQQYISDKSIADAMEALIGAHLLALGPQAALEMMKWMGIKVLIQPPSMQDPLLHYVDTPTNPTCAEDQLGQFFSKFHLGQLENQIGYRFNNKAYLLQAFTHASYYPNRITGCYQRLEFLGDAVLDYMITRFLFEHEKQYSPGVLTDLRSALVNNTIFASLAVKCNFHKHFIAMCPGLHFMIDKFVKMCKERNFFDANFHSEMYMVTTEDEIDEGQEEDVEVPKAMGDIFESVAGAVYLDCGRDLDVVWRVFYNVMAETIEECCKNPPRSPVRELLEREHDKVKFSKLERILETGKVRVTVEVGGVTKMRFTGMGRNYRIAKTTAAKRALRYLKSLDEEKKKSVNLTQEGI